MTCFVQLLSGFRSMDGNQRFIAGQQATGFTARRRKGVRPKTNNGQNRFHQASKTIGSESFGEGVNRQQPADLARTQRCIGALHHLNDGILKADAIRPAFHQTTHRHGGTGGVLTGLAVQVRRITKAFSCQKSRHLDPTGGVLKLQLNNRKIGVARTGESMGSAHRGHNCCGFSSL